MIGALFSNDNYVATKKLLDATVARHQALATNIANVEMPGFKRVDLPKDFSAEFARKLQSGELEQLPDATVATDPEQGSVRPDGNNVDLDKELLQMSSNTMQYDTLTEFVSTSLKQLRTAITGHNV